MRNACLALLTTLALGAGIAPVLAAPPVSPSAVVGAVEATAINAADQLADCQSEPMRCIHPLVREEAGRRTGGK